MRYCLWGAPPPRDLLVPLHQEALQCSANYLPRLDSSTQKKLAIWEKEGRCLTAILITEQAPVMLVAVYGYAVSHEKRCMNETLIGDILMFTSELKMPSLIMGDFNDSVVGSHILSQIRSFGLWHMNPHKETTTRTQGGGPAKAAALDHAIVNRMLLDKGAKATVLYQHLISDHYPVQLTFYAPKMEVRVWAWPKLCKEDLTNMQPSQHVAFPRESATLTQWSEQATTWLREALGIKIPPKGRAYTQIRKVVEPKMSWFYRAITAATRAAMTMKTHRNPTYEQKRSLVRKLLMVTPELVGKPLNDIIGGLAEKVTHYLKDIQHANLLRWKAKVKQWTPNQADIHRYTKNDAPPMAVCIKDHLGETTDPSRISIALSEFWGRLERWPTKATLEQILEVVDDHYSMFLPLHAIQDDTRLDTLCTLAKSLPKKAPGVDGWTAQELRKLPRVAWSNLMDLMSRYAEQPPIANSSPVLPPSLLLVYRRVPVPKNLGIPTADQIRPLDIYSGVMRLYSSTVAAGARHWLSQVAHRTQFAVKGGVIHAVARIAIHTEASCLAIRPVAAVALDFAKMYNSLSEIIARRLAVLMGLPAKTAAMLALPIQMTKGVWKLPDNAVNAACKGERGLPQGLSSSVLLAEVMIAALMHKVTLIERCSSVAYVDDIGFMTQQVQALRRIISIVCAFSSDFELTLAAAKTVVWGNLKGNQLLEVAQENGFEYRKSLQALGAEWPCVRGTKSEHKSEHQRIQKALLRLQRLKHLGAHLTTKALVASSTCLSLIDYVNPFRLATLHPLRSAVKRCLGQLSSSPEVLFAVVLTNTLDPQHRGLLTLFRIWCIALKDNEGRQLLEAIPRFPARARLGSLRKTIVDMGGELDMARLALADHVIDLEKEWFIVRPQIIRALKLHAFRCLSARRPTTFQTEAEPDWKLHSKFLKNSSPYAASVLVRVWTGVILTQERKGRIWKQHDTSCPCGAPLQTLSHILWHCELCSKGRPRHLAWWDQQEDVASKRALLCMRGRGASHIQSWKEVCKWAVRALSNKECVRSERETGHDSDGDEFQHIPTHAFPKEAKGHMVCWHDASAYAYCSRCHITRRGRDHKFVSLAPCEKKDCAPCFIGQYTLRQQHFVRLIMAKWKVSAYRPQFLCLICGKKQLATADFLRPCEGRAGSSD